MDLIFCLFATLALIAGLNVVFAKNPVNALLGLISSLVSTACLWMLLEAEFLSVMLVLVYVGAVMVLFLFVVMMLNIDQYDSQDKLSFTQAIGVVLFTIGIPLAIASTYGGIDTWQQGDWQTGWPTNNTGVSNVEQLGLVLYTEYVWPFEVVAMILLTAILVAVGLVMRKPGYGKKQIISEQLQANKADRIRLVDKKGEQS